MLRHLAAQTDGSCASRLNIASAKGERPIPVRRSQMTSEVPFSDSIAPSADPPRRESKLGRWEGELLATLPTWTKHCCRSSSVAAKPTLTLVSILYGCVVVLRGSINANVLFS